MKEAKPAALPVLVDGIPDSLRKIPRWVMWKYVWVKDKRKWAKLPFQVNGEIAKSTDKDTWNTFDAVVDAYTFRDGFDGIGFTFDGSDDVHGFDLDDCVDADGRLSEAASELLERVQGYAEVSPSKTGIKLFTHSNLKLSRSVTGFEVYRDGRYFTVTGHTVHTHKDIPESVQDVGWFVQKHFGDVGSSAQPTDSLALYKAPLPDWSLDRVKDELLPFLTPDCPYGDWILVGQALYHQGNGDKEWMEAWNSWSEPGSTYADDVCAEKWDSFSAQRTKGFGPVTLASLIKKVSDVKATQRKQHFDEWCARIDEAKDADQLLMDICPGIQKDLGIDRLSRDVLAQLLKTRFKALAYPLNLPDIKKLIKLKSSDNGPDWLEDWVYVTHEDKFFNASNKRKVSPAGFNALFNREVGGMDTENKAGVLALDMWGIPTPDKIIYLPSAPELFDMNAMPCVNGYNPNSVPDVPGFFSESDLAAIETVKSHLRLILVEPGAAQVMLAWMAHNVQYPGKKIRWAPLIKGIEGDGKSLLGKMMSAVMGMTNVGIVSPIVLATAFSGWAEGRCVNVLEEIRMVGHNRHDVLNMVKPYITNDHITVHKKGVDEYAAPNTVNYLAFTNHQDALPLDDTDRRWWVQFTPFNDVQSLNAMVDSDYFDRLHTAIEQHAGALRRWMLEYDIPATFEPNGRAPHSAAKLKMVSLNTSDDEVAVKELLAEGAPGVHKKVVSTTHLSTALSMLDGVEVPRTSALTRLLMRLGYSKIERQIKWSGTRCRVWVHGTDWDKLDEKEANELIRKLLDSTKVDSLLQ